MLLCFIFTSFSSTNFDFHVALNGGPLRFLHYLLDFYLILNLKPQFFLSGEYVKSLVSANMWCEHVVINRGNLHPIL